MDRLERAGQAVRDTKPWVERLGRIGYAAKGAVYLIVGVLAAQAAIGAGGATTDPKGALGWIVSTPHGRFLLGAMAIGLLGYAIWSFVQAGLDTENEGTNAKGLLARGGYAIIGAGYVGLALSAASLTLGSGGGGSGDESARDWTARLLAQPFGQWLTGILGAIIVAVGLYQLYKAVSANFRDKLKLAEMSSTQQEWVERIGRLGFAALGVASSIIGGLLVAAAVHARAEEARGLGGALATLAQQPFGPWLLAAVAAGLVAYGIFEFIEARFRRMVIR